MTNSTKIYTELYKDLRLEQSRRVIHDVLKSEIEVMTDLIREQLDPPPDDPDTFARVVIQIITLNILHELQGHNHD